VKHHTFKSFIPIQMKTLMRVSKGLFSRGSSQ